MNRMLNIIADALARAAYLIAGFLTVMIPWLFIPGVRFGHYNRPYQVVSQIDGPMAQPGWLSAFMLTGFVLASAAGAFAAIIGPQAYQRLSHSWWRRGELDTMREERYTPPEVAHGTDPNDRSLILQESAGLLDDQRDLPLERRE